MSVPAIMIMVLLLSNGVAVSGQDDPLIHSETDDSDIDIFVEVPEEYVHFSEHESDWSTSPEDIPSDHPDELESKDPNMSACESDLDRRICIPDLPYGQVPEEEPEDEEELDDSDLLEEILIRVERELVTFQIVPARVNVQPDHGEVLVGMDTIFYAESEIQQFSTTMLDRQVVLEVEPIQYEWDFGDGSDVFATADPGQGYPDESITHTYSSAVTVEPSLTARWVGKIWVEGLGGWFAVRGQAITVDINDPLDAVSKQNRLVPAD